MKFLTKDQTMTLKEITDLLDVRHNDAMLSVAKMAESPEFGTIRKIRSVYNDKGQTIETYILDKRQSVAVASRLNTAMLMRVIDRWTELEQQDIPKTTSEILMGSIQLQIEHEKIFKQIERDKTVQNGINDQVATQLKKLQVDTRNGVPTGFLSRAQAHRLHGRGLSKDVFEQALTSLKVESKKYIHTENDRSTQTFGWNEEKIETAIKNFISDSAQVTKTQCESQLLNGKRFRYLKAA